MSARGPSGTIRAKNGKHYPVVRFYDEKGVRRERWLTGCKTVTAAKSSLRKALTAQESHTWEPSAERMTFGEYLTGRWLPALGASGLRETTQVSYRLHVRAYLVRRLGSKPLDKITGADLGAFYGWMRTSGRKDGKGLSEATVARVHATVSRALGDAVEAHLIALNPARSVPRLVRPKQARAGGSTLRYWTAEQLGAFLTSARDEALYPLLHLAAHTGMRRGELAGLRWQDVDLDGAHVSVRQTRTSASEPGGVRVIFGEPKSGKGRRIDLDAGTVAVLRAWRAQQGRDRLALGDAWPTHGLVFTNADGSAPHPDTISGTFDRLVKASKADRITFHGLRHTHATILLMAGVPVKVVQERLGHATASITQDVYGHVTPGLQAQAAAAFAGALGGVPAATGG